MRCTRRTFTVSIVAVLVTAGLPSAQAHPSLRLACQIEVIDKETRWPVPMVELETVHSVKFVTDNAGRVAFDLPELVGRETWLSVSSDGYELPADGFGKRGVRFPMKPGERYTIEVNRTSIAKRLGRVTGAGLFGESQKLGLESEWRESNVLGCDSIQTAVYRGRKFWAWGDTSIASYPLGIFDSTAATTETHPLSKFEPPLGMKFEYFAQANGAPRGIAKMSGRGATWLNGCVTLPDKDGNERLCAMYLKALPPMEGYETGLCMWNDNTNEFDHVRTIWTKTDSQPEHPPMPKGHAVIIDGDDGKKWALFGDPFPTLKCVANFETWQDPARWETIKPADPLRSATDGAPVKPASGSIAWNAFRHRWVTVFMQVFGRPSAFGEVWYAEAESPFGPWGPAVKILSHKNYAFYNPCIQSDLTPADSPILLFEGTHSVTFADRPTPTPRYEYNQILYRIDLDDPKLAAAQTENRNR